MGKVLITLVMAAAVVAGFRTKSPGLLVAITGAVVGYAVLITIH